MYDGTVGSDPSGGEGFQDTGSYLAPVSRIFQIQRANDPRSSRTIRAFAELMEEHARASATSLSRQEKELSKVRELTENIETGQRVIAHITQQQLHVQTLMLNVQMQQFAIQQKHLLESQRQTVELELTRAIAERQEARKVAQSSLKKLTFELKQRVTKAESEADAVTRLAYLMLCAADAHTAGLEPNALEELSDKEYAVAVFDTLAAATDRTAAGLSEQEREDLAFFLEHSFHGRRVHAAKVQQARAATRRLAEHINAAAAEAKGIAERARWVAQDRNTLASSIWLARTWNIRAIMAILVGGFLLVVALFLAILVSELVGRLTALLAFGSMAAGVTMALAHANAKGRLAQNQAASEHAGAALQQLEKMREDASKQRVESEASINNAEAELVQFEERMSQLLRRHPKLAPMFETLFVEVPLHPQDNGLLCGRVGDPAVLEGEWFIAVTGVPKSDAITHFPRLVKLASVKQIGMILHRPTTGLGVVPDDTIELPRALQAQAPAVFRVEKTEGVWEGIAQSGILALYQTQGRVDCRLLVVPAA